MIRIEHIFSDPSDVNAFHDAVWDATGMCYDTSELRDVFRALSESTQWIAAQWSMGDTVFRDEAYTEIKQLIKEDKVSW